MRMPAGLSHIGVAHGNGNVTFIRIGLIPDRVHQKVVYAVQDVHHHDLEEYLDEIAGT